MDPMKTALIDSNACAPKDGGVDEEAQTHGTPRGEKTREVWSPYAAFAAFAFAFVLLFVATKVVENASALKSVRADVRDIKDTLYARARDPEPPYVVSDVTFDAAADADTAYARDLAMRYRPDDDYRERDADADAQDADAQDADADAADDARDADADAADDAFGDFVGELIRNWERR